MFTFDRDTATIVAVLMCIVATVYMYRELNKTKTEMEGVKGFYGNLMAHLSRPVPKPIVSEETQNEEVLETQVEKTEEDSSSVSSTWVSKSSSFCVSSRIIGFGVGLDKCVMRFP